VILVFGLGGYFMEENGYPVAPAILGMILGTMLEEHFISSMIKSDGRLMGFFERPIAAGLGALTLIIWLWPLLVWLWRAGGRSAPRK
jgi:TctA family transporter